MVNPRSNFNIINGLKCLIQNLQINKLGGIAKQAPIFTIYFAIFLFTVIGLPGTSGFISELLIIMGIYQHNIYLGFFAGLSILVAVIFMLWMFQRAILQKNNNDDIKMRDLNKKEIIAMFPWIVLVIVMGVYPEIFMNKFEATVNYYLFDILHIGGAR